MRTQCTSTYQTKEAEFHFKAAKDDHLGQIGVGFIRKVMYLDWIANMVLVKKKNGKWQICIDFTDLNKTCLKDSYLLPWIDQLVDATLGHEILTFIDAFFSYN